jgi:hypothetical protein
VPYYHGDIGISQEKFETWKEDLEQVSNAASAGLYSFLEQYPGLYSPEFDNSTHVFINAGESEITFSCESLNRDALESAIRSGLQDVECEISEQEPVEQQESSFFNVTFPRAETADTTVEPSLTTNQEIDDYFVSHYCNDYRTLVSLLVKFGVYESMGKGSHEGLNKDGYKYPTSQKLRSGRINLTPKLVKEILSYLKISPQEFINRALRVDRTTANHKPSLQDPKYLPS